MGLVTVTEFVRDEGTVLVFAGFDEDGDRVLFAADHRPGHDLAAALSRGEQPQAEVEPWQIVGAF